MNKKQRAEIVKKHLDKLFPNPPIPLKHKDPYTLLIAVMLSAQCTDARVNIVTPKLFAKADTPEAMCELPVLEIQKIIHTCGLSPTKAKNIKKLSQKLIDHFDGLVPSSIKSLETLPGVGHKTASVVLAQAFKKPAIGVDTHILRCTKRWGLSKSKTPLETEKDLKKLYPKSVWGKIHLQMIYYARNYCPARGHDLKKCPICNELEESN